MKKKKLGGLGSFTLLLSLAITGCYNDPGSLLEVESHQLALIDETERVLGFESLQDWSATSGQLILSDTRVEGDHALGVSGGGYNLISSILLDDFDASDGTFQFNLLLPAEQPNPYWMGQVQLYVNAPSVGIYNQWVGAVELTGWELEIFHLVTFDLPSSVLSALQGDYNDLEFSISLNVPYDAHGVYLFDGIAVEEEDTGTGEDLDTDPEPECGPFSDDLMALGVNDWGYTEVYQFSAPGPLANPAVELDGDFERGFAFNTNTGTHFGISQDGSGDSVLFEISPDGQSEARFSLGGDFFGLTYYANENFFLSFERDPVDGWSDVTAIYPDGQLATLFGCGYRASGVAYDADSDSDSFFAIRSESESGSDNQLILFRLDGTILEGQILDDSDYFGVDILSPADAILLVACTDSTYCELKSIDLNTGSLSSRSPLGAGFSGIAVDDSDNVSLIQTSSEGMSLRRPYDDAQHRQRLLGAGFDVDGGLAYDSNRARYLTLGVHPDGDGTSILRYFKLDGDSGDLFSIDEQCDGGMIYVPSVDKLYAISTDPTSGMSYLIEILFTGESNRLFQIGEGFNGGLAYSDAENTMYAIQNDSEGVSHIYSISFAGDVDYLFEIGRGFTGGLAYSENDSALYGIRTDDDDVSYLNGICLDGTFSSMDLVVGRRFENRSLSLFSVGGVPVV